MITFENLVREFKRGATLGESRVNSSKVFIIGRDITCDNNVLARRTKRGTIIVYRDWRSFMHGDYEHMIDYIWSSLPNKRQGKGKMTTLGLYYGGNHEEEL